MDVLPPLSEEDRMLSGLCYPFWPVVSPLVLFGSRREEPFVHFHALQAVALGLASLAGAAAMALGLWVVFQVLPGTAPTFSGLVGVGAFVGGLFVSLFYLSFLFYTAWRASAGQFLRLPFLGRWAEARMRQNLGLTDESFRVDPLPGRSEEEAEELPDPAELLRLHRPESRRRVAEEQDFEMEILAEPEVPAEPEPQVEEPEERFQPGLFPSAPRAAGRKFRWTPLEEEADEVEVEPPTKGGGFQAW